VNLGGSTSASSGHDPIRQERAHRFRATGEAACPSLTLDGGDDGGVQCRQGPHPGAEAAAGGSLELKKEGVATFVVKKVGLRIDAAGKAELTFSGDLEAGDADGLEIRLYHPGRDLKVARRPRQVKSGWSSPARADGGLNGFGLTLYKAGIGLENSRFWVSWTEGGLGGRPTERRGQGLQDRVRSWR